MWLRLCLLLSVAASLLADDRIQAGPMLGYADLREVAVWVQTTEPAEVRIGYRAGTTGPERKTRPIRTTEAGWLIASFVITDLEAGTTYDYSVHVNGEAVSFDYPLQFRTQVFWQYRSAPPGVSFGIGSCLFVNEERDDRPGRPYGGDFEILEAIDAARPEFFIWTGDNYYFREPDFISLGRLEHRARHTRAHPLLQPLLARTHHYALWDDHDFGPNDADRSYPLKYDALKLFERYWANPHVGLPDLPGAFCRFSWADADFFLLDERFHRAPNRDPDPGKDYLGAAQLQWLKDSLLFSRATFKFVVMGGPVTNTYNLFEAYPRYPEEYRDFIDWLHAADIWGVVFLSGDRHMSELLKTERPNTYPLYEFTSSPLTAGSASRLRDHEVDNPLRVPGTLVLGKRSFGILEIDGPEDARKLTLSARDKDGQVLWTHEIGEKELRPPK